MGARLSQTDVSEIVRNVAERVARDRQIELVDVDVGRGRGSHVVRVLIDKPQGVGLEDLRSVSEEISAILDVEDPIDSPYTLEVSSPGLDRPLRTEADFRRCVGKTVSVTSQESLAGHAHYKGRVESVLQGIVTLRLENREETTVALPVSELRHAQQELAFPSGGSPRSQKRHKRKKR